MSMHACVGILVYADVIWRAGASPPSRRTGMVMFVYIYIYIRQTYRWSSFMRMPEVYMERFKGRSLSTLKNVSSRRSKSVMDSSSREFALRQHREHD